MVKETSQIPIPSTCLSKLLDPEGQDHSGRDPFLALLMSKKCHSTREGATWTSLDQKPTAQAPQGNPEGGQAVVFPHRREPYLPSHSMYKLSLKAFWLKILPQMLFPTPHPNGATIKPSPAPACLRSSPFPSHIRTDPQVGAGSYPQTLLTA